MDQRTEAGPRCPRCGGRVKRVRGLQGFGEVLTFCVLFLLAAIPGFIYYIWIETVPFCMACGRRVKRPQISSYP
jgi:DNA-directed RNA polymerase subunit RPC12/RpoP